MSESIDAQEKQSSAPDAVPHHEVARPGPAGTRFGRWVRRHSAFTLTMVLLVALIYTEASQIIFFLPSPVLIIVTLLAWWWWQSSGSLTRATTPVSPKEVTDDQRTLEAELGQSDSDGVGKIIRLSRFELDRFYNLTIGQTQGSYRWALVASWLGLLVILSGILQLFGILAPLSHSTSKAAPAPTATTSLVTISAGAVVELVSVLFLTVYRSADRRFSYFYDRQMHLYSVFIASRISAGMSNPDATKRLIVDQILTAKWGLDQGPQARRPRRSRGQSQDSTATQPR